MLSGVPLLKLHIIECYKVNSSLEKEGSRIVDAPYLLHTEWTICIRVNLLEQGPAATEEAASFGGKI